MSLLFYMNIPYCDNNKLLLVYMYIAKENLVLKNFQCEIELAPWAINYRASSGPYWSMGILETSIPDNSKFSCSI